MSHNFYFLVPGDHIFCSQYRVDNKLLCYQRRITTLYFTYVYLRFTYGSETAGKPRASNGPSNVFLLVLFDKWQRGLNLEG